MRRMLSIGTGVAAAAVAVTVVAGAASAAPGTHQQPVRPAAGSGTAAHRVTKDQAAVPARDEHDHDGIRVGGSGRPDRDGLGDRDLRDDGPGHDGGDDSPGR